jgi:hypothetical protein
VAGQLRCCDFSSPSLPQTLHGSYEVAYDHLAMECFVARFGQVPDDSAPYRPCELRKQVQGNVENATPLGGLPMMARFLLDCSRQRRR